MKNVIFGLVAASFLVGGCGRGEDVTSVATNEAVVPSSDWLSSHVEEWREIPAPPRADEATAAVVAYLGITGTPDVHWYGGRGLDCGDPNVVGWISTGSNPPACIGGTQNQNLILVADVPGSIKISEISLAHELGHMRAWERTNGADPDPGHLMTGIFAPGGEVWRANKLLAEMGM